MMKRLYLALIWIGLFSFWVMPVQAAEIPQEFDTWTSMSTTDTLKAWMIKFNKPIDSGTVNKNNIYLTDDRNNPVAATLTLSKEENSVIIKPAKAYTVGNKYWIFVTGGITGKDGIKQLSQPIAVPFEVKGKISSVASSYSEIITSFKVTTSSDVYSVKINSTPMHYQGDNTYTLGISGLKQGGKVTIYAYDSSGKLLTSESYQI
ncbi:Ig-like domain-containing protein [Desulfitobacterium chlororespirans]|uniref:Ig-like domain-containing protein n=1 Tax=Desulfitobacterium chlororespirans DSM 11544 TaxID=1121395 RepID=A0A1M7U986_9FIRM|nr:Ig-like domain-containing protein [Desulfitobacterium chlororespirans]SHN79476.1 Ig-like domain-containing protein [Desulfitobacterium chlororespirans DSM 11544]